MKPIKVAPVIKPTISFEEFQKVDIRVGTIDNIDYDNIDYIEKADINRKGYGLKNDEN